MNDASPTRSAGAARRLMVGPLPVDAVTWEEALDTVEALVSGGQGGAVFTPNVDHVVLACETPRMVEAYARASLSLADGKPIVWASYLLGEPIPAKVSGSDFVPAVLKRAAARGWRVYFLGGSEGVAALARDKLRKELPDLRVVGFDSRRIDVDEPEERRSALVDQIRAHTPHLVFVALGAPKQEIWVDLTREALRPAVLFAVGGTLDFVAGVLPRAPRWMQDTGLEWLFRLGREPRRLWRRYLLRDPKFLLILGRAVRDRARDRLGPR